MFANALRGPLAAAVLLFGGGIAIAQGQHAEWPSDWNNWSDPKLWVTVGDPNNDADTTLHGKVNKSYRIGKFEVTAGQYTAFLNAVATGSDPYGLYNASMGDTSYASAGCNIQRNGAPGNYNYSVDPNPLNDWANRPVNYVSWGDAARLANWLHNGQHTGTLTGNPALDAGLTEDGTYSLNGATTDAALMAVLGRNVGAKYWIPNIDEWYKAAYYDPNKPGGSGYWTYPTRRDEHEDPINTVLDHDPGNHANFYDWNGTGTGSWSIGAPNYRTLVGEFENSASAYGTFDQGGNVWEWTETLASGTQRRVRGGSFGKDFPSLPFLAKGTGAKWVPTHEFAAMGFRVAGLPEPSGVAMLIGGTIAALLWLCRRWKQAI